MDKVIIVFWSQSGNTESMANAVAEGVTAAGKEAVVVDVASASLDDLKAAKGFAMGCPAMGAEVLEEGEMEPFVCDVEGFAAGKTIALLWMGRRTVDARLGRPHDSSRSNRYERRGRDLPGSTGRCSLRCMQRPRKTARSIIIR